MSTRKAQTVREAGNHHTGKSAILAYLQGQPLACNMMTNKREASASDKFGPLYSDPNFSCSAFSAGVIEAIPSASESFESSEMSDKFPSVISLKSDPNSESLA